jgi:hypothetical protein
MDSEMIAIEAVSKCPKLAVVTVPQTPKPNTWIEK